MNSTYITATDLIGQDLRVDLIDGALDPESRRLLATWLLGEVDCIRIVSPRAAVRFRDLKMRIKK
jgi:hypothetical protein